MGPWSRDRIGPADPVPDVGPLPATLFWALVMGAGGLLAWRATGPQGSHLDFATPGRLFTVLFLATTGVGTLLITASGEATGAGAAAAATGLLAFGASATFGAARWGRGTALGPPAEPGRFRPVVVLLLAGVGIAGYLAIAAGNGVPFLTADAQASRVAYAGLAFDLFRWLVPPAASTARAAALARPTRRLWVGAAAALAAVGGILFLTASRALPAELALAALLLVWWAGRRLSRRAWMMLGAIALVFFVGVQLLRVVSHGGTFRDAGDLGGFVAGRTVERVVLIQARTLELVVVEIPATQPYYLGSTYGRWLAPLSGEATPKALGTWLFERLFPGQPVGFATPGLIGELWANGGAILLLAGMAAFGLLVQWLGRLLGRFDRGAADRVLAALLVIAVARTYATSLNGLLLTAAVAVAWRLLVAGPTPPPWMPWPRSVRRGVVAPAAVHDEAVGG
jgi:hypothetical protein